MVVWLRSCSVLHKRRPAALFTVGAGGIQKFSISIIDSATQVLRDCLLTGYWLWEVFPKSWKTSPATCLPSTGFYRSNRLRDHDMLTVVV
jgi:hypothetical protein